MAELSGEEKGALLLKSLAPDVVEKVLARLGPARGARLRAVMSKVGSDRQALTEVLAELRGALTNKNEAPATLPMPSLRERSEAVGQAEAAPAASAPPGGAAQALAAQLQDPDPLKALAALPAERIARVLQGETTRTASIVLNTLDIGKAGEAFRRLPPEQQAEIAVQFSTQGMPNLEVVKRMTQALVQKSQKLEDKPAFAEGAARQRKMADMLRLLDKPQRMQVIKELEAKAPEAAAAIKPFLYRFDDVVRVDNRSMQKILKEVDTKNLALAIRDAGEPIRVKFLNNLSKRAQESLSEEIELARSASKDEVQQAEGAVVMIIQKLDLAGELVMTE
ncbi:MAG: FliG C-terminal domain-containing protein [Gemmataceae bacterium]